MTIRIITKSIWSNPSNRGQRLSRTAKAFGWQLWKRVVKKPRLLVLPNGRQFLAHPDCVVSSSLIYSKYPEYFELSLVRRTLRASDIVIDIGANVGHVGLLLSDVVNPENILAFEPTPVTFHRLCDNWSINHFSLTGLNQVAIGAEKGLAVFPDLAHPGTMNAQILDRVAVNEPTIEVELRPLDSYRDRWAGKTIGFLKVDVEGNEGNVFRGATTTLQQDRPRLIMFESLDAVIDPAVRNALSAADYRLFQFDSFGRLIPDASSNQNVFATPRECFEQIANS